MSAPDHPLLFERRLLEKVWGARRLGARLGIALPEGKAIGESWELSDHPSGESRVRGGPFAGRTLRELMERHGEALVGSAPLAAGGRFPLLVKLVDASDRLSVQVHPDDAGAARLGERDGGKNEAWVVLHADPGSVLWVGLAPGARREELEAAADRATFERLLRPLAPAAGDVIPIPAGTIHAIGPGFTLCEVQQTSDVTYRVYDWDRPASPARPLHRAQSFAVARLDARPEPVRLRRQPATGQPALRRAELPSPGSFRWFSCAAAEPVELPRSGACRIAVLLAGQGTLSCGARPGERAALGPGEAALLPANSGTLRWEPSGPTEFLLVEPQ